MFSHEDSLADTKALLDALPICVMLLDRTRAVRLLNANAETLFRRRAEIRLSGPVMHMRGEAETRDFERSVRLVFETGEPSAFVFANRLGGAELTLQLQLVRAVDMVMATVVSAPP